ncbi:uncharacterized protein N7518_001317 [Penicillium psychrosexuale]|uniref:uncharacterized protein n=1 Tax=Penicillium psychrosexuale TaxID=1002107 RepID=UPI0025452F37|nr:uncharacterized protein N7518_001317 [Penicillium psychrosexuale]KAJ5799249.1 hypothetical protein N7518_001317 [Penicillium psychrosexuale]
MGKMNDNSFHYFMRLPLELRRIIWMHCLPYRIAEEDIPDCLFNGCESNQACDTRKTMKQNAQLPTIAFVNSESRQVALEQGQILKSVEINTLELIWVQPRRDVLHINWIRLYYTIRGVDDDAPGRADEFLLHAKDLGMRPSVMAELIHPFNLKAVLDGGDGSDPPGDPSPFYTGVSVMPVLPYHCIEGDDMREMVDVLPWAKGQRSRLDIAMAGVSLHITREAALRSGLFGLLGDAPVQMVDVDDKARLREFEALFREHTVEKEPAVQRLFDAFTSSRFQTATKKWKRKAEWSILAYMWQSARDRELDILGTNPGSAWLPHLSEENNISMSQYLPDERHPWVKQARQVAPKLRLRIMVRYCTNECCIKELRPEFFGYP